MYNKVLLTPKCFRHLLLSSRLLKEIVEETEVHDSMKIGSKELVVSILLFWKLSHSATAKDKWCVSDVMLNIPSAEVTGT